MLHGAQRAFAACGKLQGVNVVDHGHVLCLRGKIDPAMFISVATLRDGIKRNPYVIVSGEGGYVDSSFYIARMLDAYDPVPVAGDMCASACASFLFLMGRHRVLLHCGDVVMHSGLWSIEDVLSRKSSDDLKQRLIADVWLIHDFYNERQISLDMINKPPARIQKLLDAGKTVFWPWSINKLRSFGVKGIVSENDPDEVVPHDYAEKCLAHKQ
ncbi:hypothetical protein PY254_16130 [Rhodanobacter sp. AS-Z3]|uniref:hypothetical protein n=1 Tax=Rhodanobacter sp. AS-Z3 TaxID=3031330 RepID=UPI002478666F|nr:hypothetical protein [Rhodanobacter sp. AS-Z3]WEN14741.1 hypothetical protein PY254_16130 [Rhodanobacter sp. AS-Z3]